MLFKIFTIVEYDALKNDFISFALDLIKFAPLISDFTNPRPCYYHARSNQVDTLFLMQFDSLNRIQQLASWILTNSTVDNTIYVVTISSINKLRGTCEYRLPLRNEPLHQQNANISTLSFIQYSDA